MSPIHWNDTNSVGNDLIDSHHKEWVRIFNKLEESFVADSSLPTALQLELMEEILAFTRVHFHEEELLMREHNYPDIVKHRRMHKDFDQEMYERFRLVMAGEVVLKSELMALIKNWFVSHTNSEDKKTFAYINSNVGSTVE